MHRILFQIGPVTIYSYGVMIALGFIAATALILREAAREGLPGDSVFDVMIALLIGGLIGGRLLFVIINRQAYMRFPLRILFFNEGGMAIQGALCGALIAGILACYLKKLPFWKVCDLIAPYAALGQAVGRIGCFLNGCCYGAAHEGFCAVTFPGEVISRFPIQIVYALSFLAIFIFLNAVRRKKLFDGGVFFLYLILFGAMRFLLDFFRGDALVPFGEITFSQTLGLAIFAVGLAGFMVRLALFAHHKPTRSD